MFNRHRVATAIPFATAALFAAGCGAQGAPEAPQQNLHGAPSVEKPLDTSAFQKEPCRSLSPQQVQTLGMGDAQGEADLEANGGPGCNWSSTSSMAMVTYMRDGDGLKQDYAKRNEYPNFKEVPPVAGYPAVAGVNNESIPPEQSGTCHLDVGVSDDLTFATQFTAFEGPDKADPCGKAQQVAGEVVKTLQAGA